MNRLAQTLLLLVLTALPLHAADYRVTPANAQAVAKQLRAGDTYTFSGLGAPAHPLVYPGGLKFSGPANAAKPIIIRMEPNAVIEGGAGDGVTIAGGSYWQVDGLNIHGSARACLYANKSPHITVTQATCRDAGVQGFLLSDSGDATVQDSEFSGSVKQHGFYGSGLRRLVFRRNKCFSNARAGCQLNGQGRPDLMNDPAWVAGTISDCEMWGNGRDGGGQVNLLNVRGVEVTGCTIRDGLAGGVAIFASQNVVVKNCTISCNAVGQCVTATNNSTDCSVTDCTLTMGRAIPAIQAYKGSVLAEERNRETRTVGAGGVQ